MGDELRGCERFRKAAFALEPERYSVQTVELEPARIAPENGRREPAFPLGVPHDFTDGIPLAHGVQNILHGLGEDAGVDKVPHKIGGLHVFGGVRRGFHFHGQTGHLQFARGENGTVMEVFLFHLLGKLKIGQRVALFGGEQKRRKSLRGQILCGVPGKDLPHPGHRGGGHLLNESGLVNGVPVRVIQRFHHAPLW